MHPPAVSYFVPPPGYLWRWAGDSAAVEWEDGATVCLWMELHALLHHLAPQGLPPLGSILLVLMACGRRHTAALTSARQCAARTSGGDQPSAASKGLLRRLGNVLESIAALPEDLRTGLPARAHLLTQIFEGIPARPSPEASAEIMFEIDTWGPEGLGAQTARFGGLAHLLRDLKALTAVHDRLDLTHLESRLRTGLDFVHLQPARVPEPPPPPGESAVPLLRQLEEQSDRELAAVAAVARRMVAMFALPRPAGFPQELPVGGISDITNRGTLDRLLPSELAADDMLLVARLANHEALYFRRDTPPDEPAARRLILMDSGIQLWGLPRLYILAAALGLKAAAGEDQVSVERRAGRVFQPLALETVAQVQTCLQELLPDPDAAAALAAVAVPPESVRPPDVFFLTGGAPRAPVREALHALAVRLSAAGGRCYVLAISRSGAMELSARSPAGSRVVARGRIDPEEILRDPAVGKPAVPVRDRLSDLPGVIRQLDFYQQYPLPFRFPSVPHPGSSELGFAHWRIHVDTQGRLMMWDPNPLLGPGEITAGLPVARNYQIGSHGGEWVVLCSGLGPGDRAAAVCIGMKEPMRREVVLDSSHPFPLWMKCQHGAAILGYSDKAEACSLTDGARQHAIILPKGTKADVVVFDGQTLGLASEAPIVPAALSHASGVPNFPAVLGVPVSAGFVASGTLVIRAQGGRWELAMPDFIFTASQKSQLSAVRPFRRIGPEAGGNADRGPAFYAADWHDGCRLIFDSRGILHLVFSDGQGSVQLTLLALLGKPVAGWVAPWAKPQVGNPDWILKPAGDLGRADQLVPLLQRFAALARAAPALQEGREPAGGTLNPAA